MIIFSATGSVKIIRQPRRKVAIIGSDLFGLEPKHDEPDEQLSV